MEKSSFTDLKLDLADACAFLESFALGRPGFTQQDALAGIQRVKSQCDRLKQLFASGPDAKEAETVQATARAHIETAENRLVLLRKKYG